MTKDTITKGEENESTNLRFLSEPNQDEYVWRYLDITRFLYFVQQEKLHFTRLDQFSDINEGAPVQHLQINSIQRIVEDDNPLAKAIIAFGTSAILADEIAANSHKHKIYQHIHFANCWFLGNRESMAMWSIYSTKESVAVRIKYKDLKQIFLASNFDLEEIANPHRISLGKVTYNDFMSIDRLAEAEKPGETIGFFKDLSYKHEDEFRIVVCRTSPKEALKLTKKGSLQVWADAAGIFDNKNGIGIKIKDFKTQPFEVVFHPLMELWARNNIETLLKNLGISFKLRKSEIFMK